MNSSTVNNSEAILVEYGNQLKPVNLSEDDNLHSIAHKIYQRFEFNQEEIKMVQLQWYDNVFGEYIDLDNETWPKFIKTQQISERNNTTELQRHLKLVHKQLFQHYENRIDQPHVRINDEQNESPLSLNDSYTMVENMPSHHTSRITEHRIGSQIEHMNQSIHTDWILNVLGWLLPLVAVLAFVGDGVWILCAYDPTSEEQHNYAGLISTILILFYYLQYDVKLTATHPKRYLIYQSLILTSILTGDILYAVYYGYYVKNTFMMIIFIAYSIIDSGYVIIVGYLKWYRQYRVSMGLSIHNLFHLMSRLEVLLIVLIPIFSTYDVICTNSIAFFILYEFFSHSYNNPDLIYSGYSRISFWLLIILATSTVICENFDFVYSRLAKDALDESIKKHYHHLALVFQYSSNISEICASIACYILLLLQFFSKSDKHKRMGETNQQE